MKGFRTPRQYTHNLDLITILYYRTVSGENSFLPRALQSVQSANKISISLDLSNSTSKKFKTYTVYVFLKNF